MSSYNNAPKELLKARASGGVARAGFKVLFDQREHRFEVDLT